MGKVTVIRTTGGLGRKLPSEDNYCALIVNSDEPALPTGANHNTVYELNSINDAEDLGLDAAFDDAQNILVYYHISEFFRLCPNGKLFIMLVPRTQTMTNMADKTNANGLAKLLRDPLCQGKVRVAALARNPAAAYIPVTTGGLDSDLVAVGGAIFKAQELAEEERDLHRPVFMLLEGRSYDDSVATFDLRATDCNKVSVVIAQDRNVADNAANPQPHHAAVGTCLGMIAQRKVNECIGWVEPGNIQDQATVRFIVPGLSSNTAISDYTTSDLEQLGGGDPGSADNGYIIPKVYVDYPGVYFNDSHTCTTSDDDFAFIENNRTMDKAERLVYKALVPKVNSPQLVDADTGMLPPSVCKYFESLAEDALSDMVKSRECSSVDAYVDPEQNIVADSRLEVKISIVPTGKASFITAVLGFKNPFKA